MEKIWEQGWHTNWRAKSHWTQRCLKLLFVCLCSDFPENFLSKIFHGQFLTHTWLFLQAFFTKGNYHIMCSPFWCVYGLLSIIMNVNVKHVKHDRWAKKMKSSWPQKQWQGQSFSDIKGNTFVSRGGQSVIMFTDGPDFLHAGSQDAQQEHVQRI